MAAAASIFAQRWKGRGHERAESQPFWLDLLSNVFGIDTPSDGFIQFEEHHKVDSSNFIDARIPSTRVLIEQKSIGVNLCAAKRQSDGALLNPFQQARRYVVGLPVSEHPRWIVTCNFSEFLIYDMEQPNGEPEQILLENLDKEYHRLRFLVDSKCVHISKEMEVSMKAGEIVGEIYDALLLQYNDASDETLRWLNILCVRIVFCLYAEDSGIFAHNQFHDFLIAYEAKDLRRAMGDLFTTLNTPVDNRSKYLQEELMAFPYTNGGLFKEEIEIPQFTDQLKQTLLQNACLDFDWSEISPTIFGAMFESTLNPNTRRSGGMHYTSIENIHKVIDPLFLNELRRELDGILEEKVEKQRMKRLDAYQDKLASLTFLDPACGSGNFLTETYLSLRRLENEAIRERFHGQMMMGEFLNPIKVSIHQFYGIEINDFAVTVATTALWISEAQMMAETEKIVHHDIDYLPLKSFANIVEGNALRMNWDTLSTPNHPDLLFTEKLNVYKTDSLDSFTGVREGRTCYGRVTKELNVVTRDVEYKDAESIINERPSTPITFDFIFGNPPFVGYSLQNREQKDDTLTVFSNYFGKAYKAAGKLDYVANWFIKASQLIHNQKTRCAFVATNSITQGEQVAAIWKPLSERFDIHIDFAYRTFHWDSESDSKAHVHCVIIGFSSGKSTVSKRIYLNNGQSIAAENINSYLIETDDIWVESRAKPLCDVPAMSSGGKPVEGGHLIFTEEEKEEFLKAEPTAEPFFRPFMGSDDYINNHPRWCLWLLGTSPDVLRSMPHVMERIEAVRQFRLNSVKPSTREYANYPAQFMEIKQPNSDYLMIPRVSSERRRYIPVGFLPSVVVASDATSFIPNATLYHFGILTSNVHNAWMRVVCGRLKSDYRYSVKIVYNNFPWPNPTEKQKKRIEQTAQAILDVRNLFPNSSLADLYDALTMPKELRKAHQENDKAVMQAYGFDVKMLNDDTETAIVSELFKLYNMLTITESRNR